MPVRFVQRFADGSGLLAANEIAIKLPAGWTIVDHPTDSLAGVAGGQGQVVGYLELVPPPLPEGVLSVARFTVDFADWSGAGSAVTHDYSVTIPSNARLMGGAVYENWIGFDDPTHAAIVAAVGTTAGGYDVAGSIAGGFDVSATTGGPFPAAAAGSANFMGNRVGTTLHLRATSTVAHLSTYTAGHVEIVVPYFVAA